MSLVIYWLIYANDKKICDWFEVIKIQINHISFSIVLTGKKKTSKMVRYAIFQQKTKDFYSYVVK